ncbi:MAG: class I SAM-dependent methyltransferase [Bordetella sp.]|nr:class I SAM-dependent methyltransferase [Bordetella sp.]
MPDLNWNASLWGAGYDWPDGGDEWSVPWGGSEPQWFGSLYPRLHRLLPAQNILEIAPGHGRWTRFLLPQCQTYLGIDLNPSCVDACRTRFDQTPHARFESNDGMTLAAAEDEAYDFIFSFDSLVHAEIDVFHAYIPEILRKLKPNGAAFIHHSNYAAGLLPAGRHDHSRGTTVSGAAVADIIAASGGAVILQEVITWIDAPLLDCLTLFGRGDGVRGASPIVLSNPHFGEEAGLIAQFQAPYSSI